MLSREQWGQRPSQADQGPRAGSDAESWLCESIIGEVTSMRSCPHGTSRKPSIPRCRGTPILEFTRTGPLPTPTPAPPPSSYASSPPLFLFFFANYGCRNSGEVQRSMVLDYMEETDGDKQYYCAVYGGIRWTVGPPRV